MQCVSSHPFPFYPPVRPGLSLIAAPFSQTEIEVSIKVMNVSVPQMSATFDVTDTAYRNGVSVFNAALYASYDSLAASILRLPEKLLSMVSPLHATHCGGVVSVARHWQVVRGEGVCPPLHRSSLLASTSA